MSRINKPRYENNDITTIRYSSGSHLHWKDHFHKNPLSYKRYGDFKADNEMLIVFMKKL